MVYFGFKNQPFSSQKSRLLLAVLLCLIFFVFIAIISKDNLGLSNKKLAPELKIDFIYVGNSDCCIIQTPKGRTFIIDSGTNISETDAKKQNRELIQNYLKKLNIREIDGLVISNWHINNYYGFIPVLKDYKVKCIYETPIEYKNEFYYDFDELCKKKKIYRISVKSGDILEWGEELFVQVSD